MLRGFIRLILRLLFVATVSASAAAAAAGPSPALRQRADSVLALLKGETPPERVFSPIFLGQVPAAQVKAVSEQLTLSHGAARAVGRIEAKSATSGTLFIDYERASVRMELAVNPSPPHLVEGLLVAGAEVKGDSVQKVFGELTALPGEVSLAAAALEEAGPLPFLTQKADRPLAIGSTFKLFVLAELVRQVKAGESKWDEVVPLGRRSLPSGILQDWPAGSPLTLHSLATLMISRSDNSATDTLIDLLGREKIEALLPALGVAAAERNRPFLSTAEVFAIKLGTGGLAERWTRADEAGRRALLAGLGRIDVGKLDPSLMGGQPMAIETVEWFASPQDIVRTLDWLRRSGEKTALDLLAVNPGIARSAAQGFAYIGFKGGSEPGVINMSFLLNNRAGKWIALSVGWNDPKRPVDEAKFLALVTRLVVLMRDAKD
jgi:beta-lactamase class A